MQRSVYLAVKMIPKKPGIDSKIGNDENPSKQDTCPRPPAGGPLPGGSRRRMIAATLPFQPTRHKRSELNEARALRRAR
jgi:hypothetical protein